MTANVTIPKTFDPPGGAIGDRLAIVAEHLQLLTSMSPENRNGHWINIPSKCLKRLVNDYRPVIDAGKRLGLLEVNERYRNDKNPFTKSYRFTGEHRHGDSKTFELTTTHAIKRYRRSQQFDADNLGASGLHYASKFPEFSIAPEALTDRANKPFWRQYTINRFRNGRHFAKRCPYGRLHSLHTQMPRTAKQYYRSTDDLVEVDVRACQPLILGILSTSKPARYDRRSALDGCAGGRCWGVGDVGRWMCLCRSGLLYSSLHQMVVESPEPAFAIVVKETGAQIKVDLRESSAKSFKRSCLIPLFDRRERMRKSPVFHAIEREFPTIAEFLVRSKKDDYRLTARMCQRLESQLMIDGLGASLAQDHPSIPVAVIHDAVIVPKGFASKATELIEQQFESLGVVPGMKTKPLC